MKVSYRLLPLLLVFFFISHNAFSQSESFSYNGKSVEISQKLINHYGNDYISNLKTSNPNHLLYLNYFSENSYTVEDIGEKASSENVKTLSSLTKSSKSQAANFNPNDLSTFNILAYGVKLTESTQAYKTNTGSMAIVVLSKKQFFDNYNNYKNSLK